MAIGETILGAVLNVVFDKLASTEVVSLLKRSKIDQTLVKKLKTLMLAADKLLDDAEEKQFVDHRVKSWLNELKHWFYRAEEVVDVISTECLRLSVEAEMPSEPESFVTKVRNFTAFSDSSNFAKKVSLEISEVVSMLESMLNQKDVLGLRELSPGTSSQTRRVPTTCLLEDPEVYGRDEDRRQIVDHLLSDEAGLKKINVIAIVGMGGLGKTTLAKMVYSDQCLKEKFGLQAWVCVSDQFDILQVTKSIVGRFDSSDLNTLQLELRDKLREKRFLIVLDDVWNENYAEWEQLCSPFHAGAQGSTVIVTTRNKAVVSTVRAVPVFYPKILSDDDGWSLFSRHAFGVGTSAPDQNLEFIGKDIVKRCQGLPLAIKALGSVLHCELGISQWEAILQSSIWDFGRRQSDVVPALWLSYHHLPSHLKRCFSYCAIFPKDYDIDRYKIVLLWLAQGLIMQPTNDNRRIEDIGDEYFNQLLSRSFLEKMGDDNSKYVIHDLVHDLAAHVSGEFITRLEYDCPPKVSGNTRHFAFISSGFDRIAKLETVSQSNCLRSFISLDNKCNTSGHISMMVSTELLLHLCSLKVLSLPGYCNFILPESIGDLKLLREIDFSNADIRLLPESISKLYNLQILNLEHCSALEKLPAGMCRLVSLRHVNLRGTTSLQEMPKQMSKLTSLQSLTDFVVGKHAAASLEELGELQQLRGELSLRRLQNVLTPGIALKVNLKSREYIDVVRMEFDAGGNDDPQKSRALLEYIQPHLNLRMLTITNYAGLKFPSWLDTGCIVYDKLTYLRLTGLPYCLSLPPLGELQRLEELYIDGMDYMTEVGPEFYGCNQALFNPFPSLKVLHFENMSAWEEWSGAGVVVGGSRSFPCLKKLILFNCPRLKGELPSELHSLEELVIDLCEQLVGSLPQLPSIRELGFWKNPMLNVESTLCFTSLRSLTLIDFDQLQDMSLDVAGLSSLATLSISYCENLEHLVLLHLAGLSSLVALTIAGCANLKSLEAMELPMNLKEFNVEDCKTLEYLPKEMEMLSHLKTYSVGKCPCLRSVPASTLPTSLENFRVNGCERWEFPIPILGMHLYTVLVDVRLHWTGNNLEVFPLGVIPNLQELSLWSCGGLKKVYVPDGISSSGLVSLRSLEIRDCPNLEIVGKETSSGDAAMFPRVPNLEKLVVVRCEKVKPVAVEGDGVPTKLKSLDIDYKGVGGGIACKWEPNTLLLRFSHLQDLTLHYNQSVECFPDEGCLVLPKSLESLFIIGFKKLKKLDGEALRALTSLKGLQINDCSELECLPQRGLPPSLGFLQISGSPKVKERCEKDKGLDWHLIRHIPQVII